MAGVSSTVAVTSSVNSRPSELFLHESVPYSPRLPYSPCLQNSIHETKVPPGPHRLSQSYPSSPNVIPESQNDPLVGMNLAARALDLMHLSQSLNTITHRDDYLLLSALHDSYNQNPLLYSVPIASYQTSPFIPPNTPSDCPVCSRSSICSPNAKLCLLHTPRQHLMFPCCNPASTQRSRSKSISYQSKPPSYSNRSQSIQYQYPPLLYPTNGDSTLTPSRLELQRALRLARLERRSTLANDRVIEYINDGPRRASMGHGDGETRQSCCNQEVADITRTMAESTSAQTSQSLANEIGMVSEVGIPVEMVKKDG
ncbi:unnamed protein product, partial [Owenia fusiformis]